jgi:hypothetical protein
LVETVKITVAISVQPEGVLVAVTVIVAVVGVLTKTIVALDPRTYGVVAVASVNSVLATVDVHVNVEAIPVDVTGTTALAQIFPPAVGILTVGLGLTVTTTLSGSDVQPLNVLVTL